jgi:type IX secretion system PorP/SprF family membrane protein
MKKSLYTFLALSFVLTNTQAQQLPLFSQYYYNPFIYNPGFTGQLENTQAYLIHRSQWKEMPGAPVTYALTVDGPVKSKAIGLGISLFNDQMDIFNRTGLYASYSYRINLSGDHYLIPGISFGVIDNKIDFSKTNPKDINDPLLFGTNRRKITMDATFGMAYMWNDLKIGIAVPQLLGSKIRYLQDDINVYMRLRQHILFSAQYDVKINDDFTLMPNIMTRWAKSSPFQIDINALVDWKKMLRGGLSYRLGYAMGFNVGVTVNKNLMAGYCYEYVLSPIGRAAGGGHEIMLGYSFGSRGGSAADEEKLRKLNEQLDRASAENDSLINQLKKKDSEHSNDIQYLKEELEKLKQNNNNNSKDEGNNNNNKNERNKDIRSEKLADYIDDNGAAIQPGYYVIIESFKSKTNAQNAKKAYENKVIYKPQLLYNKPREFYYVSVYYTGDEQTALDVVTVLKNERPDVWIFSME